MLDVADLEMNVLEFVHKSFAFARTATVEAREAVVFQRTETESESQFRPKIVRLYLVIPHEWVVFDGAQETLRLAHDGKTLGITSVGEGVETGAESVEFTEQGIAFHRLPLADRSWAYLPSELESTWGTPDGLRALGLTAPRSTP
jgi:hypothetical protein